MRKGIFIPDITVEMFKNASLEAVEELLVSGSMEDIEIPERPHGEWVRKNNSNSWFECSVCKEVSDVVTIMREPTWKFCPNCGADMREGDAK